MKKRADSNSEEAKIKSSLSLSIKEGSYASVMSGFGVSYFSPFAIALKASASQIGLLNALTSLLPTLTQLFSTNLIQKYTRKKIVNIFTSIQNWMFIPIILTALLFYFHVAGTIWILIALITFFYSVGAMAGPAWFSWMGSLVPEKIRGKYFANRNRITGFFGLVTMLLGGIILDKFKALGLVLIGFAILFLVSFLARSISIRMLNQQYEPKLKIHKSDYFSFWQFISLAPKTPFGRFTILTALFVLAVNISGPFFTVYMLDDLNLSYTWFTLISVSATIFQLFFYSVLGRFSDRFGNVKLLKISGILVCAVPILWMFSKNPWYLLTVPQLISGLGWAGFNLGLSNYIYDAVRPEKRSFCVTYFNILHGFGAFFGALIGSGIALMNIAFMNKILLIFLVSGLARFVFLFFFIFLQEVRKVSRVSARFFVHELHTLKEIHPTRGFVREFYHFNHGFSLGKFQKKVLGIV
jgi:MFS family permease